MAADNYEQCLAQTLRWEGGWSNHPADPGGATMRGVIQSVYDGYRRRKGLPTRSVRQIEEAELQDIYRRQYWDAVKGDALPAGLDLAIFDFAVNSGPSRAAKFLQRKLGVAQDGNIGEATLAKIRDVASEGGIEDLATEICDERLAWLKTLRTWSVFGKGWANRVRSIRKAVLDMADGVEPARPSPDEPLPPATGKAQASDQKPTSTITGQGAAATGLGGAGTVLIDLAKDLLPLGEMGTIFQWIFAGVLLIGVAVTVYGVLKTARSPEVLA